MKFANDQELMEALPKIIRDNTTEFDYPVRCLIAFIDGSVWKLECERWDKKFDPIHGMATPSKRAYPYTLMFVDAKGRELNILVGSVASSNVPMQSSGFG